MVNYKLKVRKGIASDMLSILILIAYRFHAQSSVREIIQVHLRKGLFFQNVFFSRG